MVVKISDLSAVSTPLAGTEIIACVQTTTKKVTTAQLAAYTIDVLQAASAATPTTGDYILSLRSGTEKLFTLDAVASYAVASGWSVATEADPAVTGDMLLLQRSGTVYKVDVDTISAYVLSGIQATVLDISGLTTATLTDADEYLVCQSGAGKKIAWTGIATRAHTQFRTYVEGLSAVGTLADADLFYVSQSGTAKSLTATVLADYIVSEVGADIVDIAWDGAAVNPLLTGDVFVLQRSNVQKTATVDTIVTYTDSVLAATAEVSPVATGDKFLLYRSGTRKLATISDIFTYVDAQTWTASAVSPVLSTDVVEVQRSGVTKTATLADVQTMVLSGIQATVLNVSGLSVATLAGTDLLMICQGTTATKATLTAVEAHAHAAFSTYVTGLTDAATVADADKFYIVNGSTPKYCTGSEIAAYVIDEAWSSAAAVAGVTGDTLLLYRAGTGYRRLTIDLLKTFVETGLQATILDLTTLSTDTLSSSDLMVYCKSGVPKQAPFSDFGAKALTGIPSYVGSLNHVTTTSDTDKVMVLQGSTPRYATMLDVANHAVNTAIGNVPWTLVAASKYTATPAATNRITMSNTSNMRLGLPIKYTYNGIAYYGIVGAIIANNSITIAGAPLDIGQDITDLRVGLPSQVVDMLFLIPGDYDAGVQDILTTIGHQYFKWLKSAARLAAIGVTHRVADSGAAQPKINVKVDGNLVCTADSNKGLQLSTAGTWVQTGVNLSTANYIVARNNVIDVRLTEVGTNGNAQDLTVALTFVLE